MSKLIKPKPKSRFKYEAVKKNRFGFYELVEKPTPSELEEYYAKKYFQDSQGAYQTKYSSEEKKYINNKLEQKYLVAQRFIPKSAVRPLSFLDVGAGEGWALSYFRKKQWCCLGIDYSEYGCKLHNQRMLKHLTVGDIYENINKLVYSGEKYNLIMLIHVLEHVLDPFLLLTQMRNLLTPKGVLVIEVPNDFSSVQMYLLERRYVSRQYWVTSPDHISYFNKDGLVAICREAGLKEKYLMGDFPIDLFLLNENTNYIENTEVGKSCHTARVAAENLFNTISPKKTSEMYEALAELGIGREIIGFFQCS